MVPIMATKVSGGFTLVFGIIIGFAASNFNAVNSMLIVITITQVFVTLRGPIMAFCVFKKPRSATM